MTKHVAVFGSLREGEYNFERYGVTNVLARTVISGYKMYDLGPFPAIVESEIPEDKITVELHEVSEENYDSITWMEVGAGYTPKTITINNIEATIYTMKRCHGPQVVSGDWVTHNKNKRR